MRLVIEGNRNNVVVRIDFRKGGNARERNGDTIFERSSSAVSPLVRYFYIIFFIIEEKFARGIFIAFITYKN